MADLCNILQHPWLAAKGAASDKPMENEIQQRLKNFQGVHKLQRQALKLIASYMPPEEVQGLRNQFLAIDKDRNGVASLALVVHIYSMNTSKGQKDSGTVTVDELREALTTNGKLPINELEQLLQDVDMNASGAIDYEEFLAATLHASKISTDEHLQRAFQEFDTDGSGAEQCGVGQTIVCCF